MILFASSNRREGLVRVKERRDAMTACAGSLTKCLAEVDWRID